MNCGETANVIGYVDMKDHIHMFDSLQRQQLLLKYLHDKHITPRGLLISYNNIICILPPWFYEIGIYNPWKKDIDVFGHICVLPVSTILATTSIRCQGLTIPRLKYKYPLNMEKSPIINSVYVTLSRVSNFNNIEMNGNVLLSVKSQKFMKPQTINYIKKLFKIETLFSGIDFIHENNNQYIFLMQE